MKENVACSAILSQSMNIKFLSILLAIVFPATITFAQDNRILSFEQAKILADKGDAYGEAVVAFHYSIGWQTDKNLELAAKYAMSSARKNHPLGIFRLGALRRAGEGAEKNEEQGLALQKNSFNGLNKMSGNPYAITALGVMLFQGKVVPENKKEAARLYKIAADMGFAPAQFNFAMCAEAGHGTPQSELLSIEYLTEAIENDYTLALSALKPSDSESLLLQNSELQSDLNQTTLNETKTSSVSQPFLKNYWGQAYEIAQPVDQTYKLQGSALGAYKGFIGNKPIKFEVFWGNEKTIAGRATVGRADYWNLVGLIKRDGEITLRAFYRNEEMGTFFLNKISDAKNDRLLGKFLDKNKSALAVRITRIPNSEDCGPRHPFSNDNSPLASYLIWKNNDRVSLTMEPLLRMSLKRAGDIVHPNIEVWENLPDNLSSGLIYSEKNIVFVGYEKSISALDIQTGGVIWRVNLPIQVSSIKLSAKGNFIYALGGMHNELEHTYSLWRIPVDCNGDAVELLRTFSSGSEGGLPAGASGPQHIPETDKFIMEIQDEQNLFVFTSRKQSAGRQLFCFDAIEMSLKKIDSSPEALTAYFTRDSASHAHSTEDNLLASVQSTENVSASINLIKRSSNLELYVLNQGTETTLHKWPLDSSEISPLWFAGGKVIGYDLFASPKVFANTDEPGDFVFSTKVTSVGSNRKEQIQEIVSENYKIRAVAKYFGLFIEITDKQTGKKIFDSLDSELPKGLRPVGYEVDPIFRPLAG